MESFDDPVGFGVLGFRGVELDGEAGCECRPEVGGEDGTSVGGDDVREAEYGDLAVDEGLEAVLCCCALHRYRLGPSGCPVDGGEEISAAA